MSDIRNVLRQEVDSTKEKMLLYLAQTYALYLSDHKKDYAHNFVMQNKAAGAPYAVPRPGITAIMQIPHDKRKTMQPIGARTENSLQQTFISPYTWLCAQIGDLTDVLIDKHVVFGNSAYIIEYNRGLENTRKRLLGKINETIGRGFRSNISYEDLAKQISKIYTGETKNLAGWAADILGRRMNDLRLDMLIRSGVTEFAIKASNDACPLCEEAARKTYTEDEVKTIVIPLHPNCRCIWTKARNEMEYEFVGITRESINAILSVNNSTNISEDSGDYVSTILPMTSEIAAALNENEMEWKKSQYADNSDLDNAYLYANMSAEEKDELPDWCTYELQKIFDREVQRLESESKVENGIYGDARSDTASYAIFNSLLINLPRQISAIFTTKGYKETEILRSAYPDAVIIGEVLGVGAHMLMGYGLVEAGIGTTVGKGNKIINSVDDVSYGQKSLDKAFSKHSSDFGIYPDGSRASVELYKNDLNGLLNTGVQKSGLYRATSGTHVYNPSTRQWVFYNADGSFNTAFTLSPNQYKYLIETGVVK